MSALASAPIVKTAVFEGPLDLLLELIESRKLLINDISLAEVTDEYIRRISGASELSLGEVSEFAALAATLLLIKSRSLLPLLELSDEETQDIKELQYRLALYQIMKEAARGLARNLQKAPLWEGIPREQEPLFMPDKSITLQGLHGAMLSLIDEFPQAAAELPKTAVKKILSLEEMVDRLASRITSAAQLSFKEFSGHGKKSAEKGDIVVSFLALLELMKQGMIRAVQQKEFGDIVLEHTNISTPSYE